MIELLLYAFEITGILAVVIEAVEFLTNGITDIRRKVPEYRWKVWYNRTLRLLVLAAIVIPEVIVGRVDESIGRWGEFYVEWLHAKMDGQTVTIIICSIARTAIEAASLAIYHYHKEELSDV